LSSVGLTVCLSVYQLNESALPQLKAFIRIHSNCTHIILHINSVEESLNGNENEANFLNMRDNKKHKLIEASTFIYIRVFYLIFNNSYNIL